MPLKLLRSVPLQFIRSGVWTLINGAFSKSSGERGGSVAECRTPEREVGVRNLPPPCCVLEQDILLPESTG